MNEKQIQREIMLAIGARPEVRVWRNNSGQVWTGNNVFIAKKTGSVTLSKGDVVIKNAHPIRFGLPGSPDIIGIKKGGQFLGIEVKTPKGKVSELQENFGKMIQKFGGVWIVARNVSDAENIFK